MTNEELRSVINLAQEKGVKSNTLRRLFNLIIKDKVISTGKINQLKKILLSPSINDPDLLTILEKAYQKKLVIWNYIENLNNHPLIKEYFLEHDFAYQEWQEILASISMFSNNNNMDRYYMDRYYIYLLEKLYSKKPSLEEVKFFHKVFLAALNSILRYSEWYFNLFLNFNIPLTERKNIFTIIKQNILNMSDATFIDNIEEKAKKVVLAYHKYGAIFANTYATVIVCVSDINLPEELSKEEVYIYQKLFEIMCYVCLNGNLSVNFLNSKYYQFITNKNIASKARQDIVLNLTEKELILKDEIVLELISIYREKGLKAMLEVKYAFLNTSIRRNLLCKKFLLEETNIEVLELARNLFKINRVRHSIDDLNTLLSLTTKEEKINFIKSLLKKYPDITEEELERRKLAEETAIKDANEAFNAFLNKRIGYKKLQRTLDSASSYEFEIKRGR